MEKGNQFFRGNMALFMFQVSASRLRLFFARSKNKEDMLADRRKRHVLVLPNHAEVMIAWMMPGDNELSCRLSLLTQSRSCVRVRTHAKASSRNAATMLA
jgi:hypothetical protein